MEHTTESRELALYAINTEKFYRDTEALRKNFAKKMKKGTFDKQLAIKGLRPFVTLAARYYATEFAAPQGWSGIFSVRDRELAATEILEHYTEEIQELAGRI